MNEPVVAAPEPLEALERPFAVVQPFPTVELTSDELVRAPREYSTLVSQPQQPALAV